MNAANPPAPQQPSNALWAKLSLSNPSAPQQPAAERSTADGEDELRSLIAFSRGVTLGFVGALLVFDWGLQGAKTTQAIVGSALYLL